MDRVRKAEELYLGGYNCCQSVVATFSDELGFDVDTALKIASGFGGGLKVGEVCGVITGAVMVIGLKNGYNDAEDAENKTLSGDKTKEFQERFKEEFKGMLCRDLLGYDVSIEEQGRYAKENGISKKVCPKYVLGAVRILEEIL